VTRRCLGRSSTSGEEGMSDKEEGTEEELDRTRGGEHQGRRRSPIRRTVGGSSLIHVKVRIRTQMRGPERGSGASSRISIGELPWLVLESSDNNHASPTKNYIVGMI
jgi:hypothetical protein